MDKIKKTQLFPTIRLGLIIPSSNTTVEPEVYRMLAGSPQITIHISRVRLVEVTTASLNQMETGIEQAASLLAEAAVEAICLACTSVSFREGKNQMIKLRNIIHQATNTLSLTTSECVLKALKTLKTRRLGLVTPYVDELNALEIKFLLEAYPEMEITGLKTFNLRHNLEIGRLNLTQIYDQARALVSESHPDTLFLSCTNMPSAGLLQSLEDELGISVFSSNSASLFGLLRVIDYPLKIKGFGKLLEI